MQTKRRVVPRLNLVGDVYGRFTVIAYTEPDAEVDGWVCRCSCGTVKVISTGNLRSGGTKSCGCALRETLRKRNEAGLGPIERELRRNPETKDALMKTKSAFSMTKQRCYTKTCRDYKYYGGRGITVDSRWLESFDNFILDMGLRPEGMTLDRVDNDGPYTKSNCRWASRAIQSNNTRATKMVTWQGETKSVAEWERTLGFKPGTLKARLGTLNYTVEQAFTKPVKFGLTLENHAKQINSKQL